MYQARIKALQKVTKTECIMIASPENLFYYSGFTGKEAILVIGSTELLLFTDSRYLIQAKEEAPDFEIIDIKNKKAIDYMAEKKVKSIAYEAEFLSAKAFFALQERIEGAAFEPIDSEILEQRAIKDSRELAMTKNAAELADAAFLKVLSSIRAGVREKDIAMALEWDMRKNGAQGASFEIVCASGLRSAMPHGTASDKIIETGDFVTLDFGCFFEGYASDMTRTVVIGKATDKQREIYETVLQAQKAALAVISAGVSGCDADKTARDIIKDAGYGDYFGHALGHGTGLMIHEQPVLSPRSEKKLVPGMLVTVEPGIYIENLGGVRIEDLVYVTEQGHLNLTTSDKELLEL